MYPKLALLGVHYDIAGFLININHLHYYTVLQILFLVGVGQHFHDICANRGIMEMIPS